MEQDLSILTERQKTAFLLRQQGLTYEKIGRQMGISPAAAGRNVKLAERRFREYQRYHDGRLRNTVPVEFPLTRGELRRILEGLEILDADLANKAGAWNIRVDWMGRLPYEAQLVGDLMERAQMALYGRVLRPSEGKMGLAGGGPEKE